MYAKEPNLPNVGDYSAASRAQFAAAFGLVF